MFIIGLIKKETPRILINPQNCASLKELYAWLKSFLSDSEFKQNSLITLEQVQEAVESENPSQINFDGTPFALLFGKESVIYKSTDEFVQLE